MKLSGAESAPWPVAISTASTADTEMITSVAVATTWRLQAGKLVAADAAEHWPVIEKPQEVAGVALGSDLDFRRDRCALMVIGDACAPGGRPVSELAISLHCGKVEKRSHIFGDRAWRKRLIGWSITTPTPFTTMPISNDRAYGGIADSAGEPVPHGINPGGRGFHITADKVDGTALPNLEHAHQRISAWRDQPLPEVWYKPATTLPDGPTPERPEDAVTAALPQMFSDAVPSLTCPRDQLGHELVLTGFTAAGTLSFPLPRRAPATLRMQVGEQRSAFAMTPLRIVAVPAAQAVIITWAACCRWRFSARESRTAHLTWDAHV